MCHVYIKRGIASSEFTSSDATLRKTCTMTSESETEINAQSGEGRGRRDGGTNDGYLEEGIERERNHAGGDGAQRPLRPLASQQQRLARAPRPARPALPAAGEQRLLHARALRRHSSSRPPLGRVRGPYALTHLLGELVPEVAVQEQLGEDTHDEQQHRSELHTQHAYLRTDETAT